VIILFEEILPNIYKIEVILPQNPLRALNSYVLKGQKRNLIIDTGMNREECLTVLTKSLQELEVDLANTDFFITHMHADHSGLISYFQTKTSNVFCSQIDAEMINLMNSDEMWNNMHKFCLINGFPEDELYEAINNHPGFKYRNRANIIFQTLREGSSLNVGDYHFKCIETPGHTKGHMCLYEADKKLLISGDHVLHDITPNLMLLSDNDNPLADYLKSLEKVYELEVKLVLPGHRKIFQRYQERIRELKKHHQVRTNEALQILGKVPQDAYQIASQMKWDVRYNSWNQFPPQQKLFATGEVLAHLKYLEEKGEVKKDFCAKRMVYQREARSLWEMSFGL
jgi:glyoxylase-like metal-dependent hydrolase (beta-lactamase superfamily II)